VGCAFLSRLRAAAEAQATQQSRNEAMPKRTNVGTNQCQNELMKEPAVASIARRVWHRVRSSLADEVAARGVERDVELFRQMSDVFKELARISVDLGAVWHSVEGLRAQIDSQAATLAELLNQIDAENQSTEILGRLLQSARARLDVLEGAAQSSA
jgi:hypothetical protein